jgi:hypothetical protein
MHLTGKSFATKQMIRSGHSPILKMTPRGVLLQARTMQHRTSLRNVETRMRPCWICPIQPGNCRDENNFVATGKRLDWRRPRQPKSRPSVQLSAKKLRNQIGRHPIQRGRIPSSKCQVQTMRILGELSFATPDSIPC